MGRGAAASGDCRSSRAIVPIVDKAKSQANPPKGELHTQFLENGSGLSRIDVNALRGPPTPEKVGLDSPTAPN
jgi:hypothetical protein